MTEDFPRRGITFQCGLARESYGFEGKELTALKELACSFLDQKFPDHGYVGVLDKLLLYRHNYSSSNILERITNVEQMVDGSVIEIVLSAKVPEDETIARSHQFTVHSYKAPSFCDFCGQMLYGLVRQGLKCEGCGGNYHKRCAYRIRNNCSDSRHRNSTQYGALQVSPAMDLHTPNLLQGMNSWNEGQIPGRRATWSGDSLIWDKPGRIQVPHTFAVHSYKKPTMCQICKKLLRGLFRQGFQCKDCKFNCHRKCAEKAPKNCLGDILMFETGSSSSSYDSGTISETLSEMDLTDDVREDLVNEEREAADDEARNTYTLEECTEPSSPTSTDGDVNPTSSTYIPLQRIVVSVKHTKRKASKVLKQGWMVHFTNKDMQRRRHYWRLDTKSLTLFLGPESNKYYKEIPLSEILSVESNIDPLATEATRAPHCFEMKTRNMIYYVGLEEDEHIAPDPDSGVGTGLGQTWADTIRSALMPGCVTPTTSLSAMKSMPPESSMDTEMETPSEEPAKAIKETPLDITQLYQVFPDEILGSGQFGIVYGGVHRESGREVAVKVIDKLRFPTKQEAQLKNEVAILKQLNHPGMVTLEQMFETPERVFVVMEKLRGDMLEMILSSPNGKLDERCTRFLITQILIALKYLHSKNIVHCDLKPENVLLSPVISECGYPAVKLCDFGFARIIEEKSFRRSVVGTPAYLAPEVLLNQPYNRSLDMWSVGVVVYVSLSGTFPFNEEEDIQDQIHNAAFMYPPDPWQEISRDAINLISNLLQVKQRSRYTCDKCLIHPWLQNYQTWLDLRSLERVIGFRYLTHESDDAHWHSHGEQLRSASRHHQYRDPQDGTGNGRQSNNRFFPPTQASERKLQPSISYL
ncbi:serine/threonine-protein kinase D3-like [Actinia tenebrosa]|uniref:protein kinase C n=1 Tax=Actinia tenebrosa TaxID=6105 RepID=A0A6P8HJA4_ACTTE|nr:serine/threonine-protein kinase D3-like [Actinia tenebrosa]